MSRLGIQQRHRVWVTKALRPVGVASRRVQVHHQAVKEAGAAIYPLTPTNRSAGDAVLWRATRSASDRLT